MITDEIKWLARRYARYLASGCTQCWSNCHGHNSNKTRFYPDREDKCGFEKALKDPNYDTSIYERYL